MKKDIFSGNDFFKSNELDETGNIVKSKYNKLIEKMMERRGEKYMCKMCGRAYKDEEKMKSCDHK